MQVDMNSFDLFNPGDEHRMLRETLRDFVRKEIEPQALEFDRSEKFNLKLFRKIGDLGLLGLTVSEEFGGAGMDATAVAIVHEEISASDPGFGLAYLAHTLLCVNNLFHNASDEQKARLLPRLCSGEWVGAMAITEPDCGTDVSSLKTTAVRDGDHYILNGRKMWITNGCVDDEGSPADAVIVYAKSGEKNGRIQISTFLVEKSHKGYSVGQKIKDKLGMRASNTAELVFDNCIVPVANRLGEEGEGFLHMMRNLEIERVGLASQSLGIARRSIKIMSQYAQDRKAFGKSLSQFGQIQKHIADSISEYRACKTYVYDVARRMNLSSQGNRIDSDGAKLVAAKMGKAVADRAIQVLGGYGYVGEYVVERLWRDAKLLEIGGGTNEAHQKNIVNDLIKNPEFLSNM